MPKGYMIKRWNALFVLISNKRRTLVGVHVEK
jgi:hypothetical protein